MAFGDLKRHWKKEFYSIFKKENVNNFKNPNIFEKNYSIYFDFKNKQDKDITINYELSATKKIKKIFKNSIWLLTTRFF